MDSNIVVQRVERPERAVSKIVRPGTRFSAIEWWRKIAPVVLMWPEHRGGHIIGGKARGRDEKRIMEEFTTLFAGAQSVCLGNR